jgi:hypothetical protein
VNFTGQKYIKDVPRVYCPEEESSDFGGLDRSTSEKPLPESGSESARPHWRLLKPLFSTPIYIYILYCTSYVTPFHPGTFAQYDYPWARDMYKKIKRKPSLATEQPGVGGYTQKREKNEVSKASLIQ